jgi:hypothetical protein
MSERFEADPPPEDERAALARLAERLQRERPLPAPAFRGELRRRLLERPRPAALGPWRAGAGTAAGAAPRWRLTALCYAGAGLLCLVVAGAGLAGAGPFAA